MKRLISLLPVVALTLVIGVSAQAAYEPEVDYTQEMIYAVMNNDSETGYALELARNEKVDALGLSTQKFAFEDLKLLSKIIYAEAGSEWLSDDWKMSVGEVVLNRVASSEFPNTLKEVLEQPGQYYGKNSRYFNNLKPNERCANAAIRLLSGERILEPSVVFQANFKQGGGAHTSYYDKYLGWTYFCYSSNRSLYNAEVVPATALEVLPVAVNSTPEASEETVAPIEAVLSAS